MITRRCLEYIKDTVDIYDVVSPYVNLKKCGSNWRGLSPFTSEKTPSFFVMPAKKMFKCFSSGNAGDLFRFIQLKENVSFFEAVEMIADRFNITLELEKSDKGNNLTKFSKKDFFEINELANAVFRKNFEQNDSFGQKIRKFWQDVRGFSLESAKKNGIGLCKNDEAFILKVLSNKFSLNTIKESGLFYFNSDDLRTFRLRFRYRLTIPIKDIQGRIVGFSARVVPDMTSVLTDAKYINSPETEIFHKGALLFGLNEARLHIEQFGYFWLVEGQLDVLRCWEMGLSTAVAPQGTAITDTQLQILRRYASTIYCLLDGDEAGLRAAERLLPMTVSAGLEVKYYLLPGSSDPDSFFKKCTPEFLKKFIQSDGISAMEFVAKRYFHSSMSGRQKADALQHVYEIISCSDLSIMRESLLDEIAQLCNLDRRAIGQDFDTFIQRKRFNAPLPIQTTSMLKQKKNDTKIDSVESQLLAVCLDNPVLAKKISDIIEFDSLLSVRSVDADLLVKVLNEAHEGMWEGIVSLNNSKSFSEDEKNRAYSILAENYSVDDLKELVNSCLKIIHLRFCKEKIIELDKKFNKISLDEKEMIRNLQRDRMYLRQRMRSFPQIDSVN